MPNFSKVIFPVVGRLRAGPFCAGRLDGAAWVVVAGGEVDDVVVVVMVVVVVVVVLVVVPSSSGS